MPGRALVLSEDRSKHAPAGALPRSYQEALLNCRTVCLALVCALSTDHIAYLTAAGEKGVPCGEAFDLDLGPELKSFLSQRLRLVGPRCRAELFLMVDRAMQEGSLPREIRIPGRAAVY